MNLKTFCIVARFNYASYVKTTPYKAKTSIQSHYHERFNELYLIMKMVIIKNCSILHKCILLNDINDREYLLKNHIKINRSILHYCQYDEKLWKNYLTQIHTAYLLYIAGYEPEQHNDTIFVDFMSSHTPKKMPFA